jgi:hypothetical protein
MMGARLVAKAIQLWPDLTDRQHRVLTTMALTAKDGDEHPAYFKGRDYLVSTLGMAPGTPASYESVRKVVTGLVSKGAIKRAMFGHNGRNSVYELTLDRDPSELLALPNGAPTPVEIEGESETKTHSDSAPVDPLSEWSRPSLKEVKGHSHSAPKEIEEEEDLSLGGKSPSKVTTPSASVAAARSTKKSLDSARARLAAERSA